MADRAAHAGLDQGAGSAGVVAVVIERSGHRFGHDDAAGKMHHG